MQKRKYEGEIGRIEGEIGRIAGARTLDSSAPPLSFDIIMSSENPITLSGRPTSNASASADADLPVPAEQRVAAYGQYGSAWVSVGPPWVSLGERRETMAQQGLVSNQAKVRIGSGYGQHTASIRPAYGQHEQVSLPMQSCPCLQIRSMPPGYNIARCVWA